MSYSIGQYHSESFSEEATDTNYWTNLIEGVVDKDNTDANGITPVNVQGTLTDSNTYNVEEVTFRDKAIIFTKGFSSNENYYVQFGIKRNAGNTITYNIKLVTFIEKTSGPTTVGDETNDHTQGTDYLYNESADYQHLKTVVVQKGTTENSATSQDVYLYVNSNNVEDRMVSTIEPSNYQYATNFPVQKASIDVSEWYDDVTTDAYELVTLGFKPVQDGFNGILIQKEINTDDYAKQYTEEGGTYRGIKTEISDNTVCLYQLKDIIGNGLLSLPDNAIIKKIGIWGHSGLGFMINDEEIHIGARGYYELNIEDYDIKKIAPICLDGDRDRFLIDYEYQIEK